MQIRCQSCHKPYAMSKEAVHAALEQMQQEDLKYYNVHCPHCGKANRVPKDELLRAAPEWKGAAEAGG